MVGRQTRSFYERGSLARTWLMALLLMGVAGFLASCMGGGGTEGTPTATLESITVTPANASVAAGLTEQYTATGTYSDGSTKDITGSVTWSSSNTGVATIAQGGLATTIAEGVTTITATLSGVSGSTTLTVTAATCQTLAISPIDPTVAVGGTQQFTVTCTYTDGTTQNLTGESTFTSSDTTVATIGATTGLADALYPGTTTITATDTASGKTASTTLTVTANTFAYVTDFHANPGTISEYSLDTANNTGALAALNPSTVSAGGYAGPYSITIDPSGVYVYTSNFQASAIYEYSVTAATGQLAQIGTISTGTSTWPNAIAMDHGDRYVYTANIRGNSISQFTIGTGGVLASMTPATVSGGGLDYPASIVVDPSNQYAYVGNFGNYTSTTPSASTIAQFTVGTTGALTAMTTPTVASGFGPAAIVVDPSGKYVYAANMGGSGTVANIGASGTVSQYTIGTGGALTAMTPATVATQNAPSGITTATETSGTYVYVANSGSNTISGYSIGTNGALTSIGTFTAGTQVYSVTVDSTNTWLYATNRGANTVYQYTINATTGALTQASSVATGSEPTGLVIGYSTAAN